MQLWEILAELDRIGSPEFSPRYSGGCEHAEAVRQLAARVRAAVDAADAGDELVINRRELDDLAEERQLLRHELKALAGERQKDRNEIDSLARESEDKARKVRRLECALLTLTHFTGEIVDEFVGVGR